MKRVFSFVIVFCSSLVISLSGTENTVKIGAVFPKTGDAMQFYTETGGFPEFEAIRIAVDEVNNKGGILGKKIEVIEYDNQSTALGSKKAAEMAVKDGVIGVIGSAWSSHSLAMAPVLQEAKIPMISPLSTNPEVTLVGDYIFRACFIDSFQGTVMADFAVKDLKAKKAVVLTNTSEIYCIELVKFFNKRYVENGGNILWKGEYLGTITDFKPIIEKISSLKPDIVFVPGTNRDSSYLIKQSRASGITIPFLGGDAWYDDMYTYAGNAIEGCYHSSHWHPDNTNEKSQKFVKEYNGIYKKIGKELDQAIPLAYDATMLLIDAAKRANSFDTKKIRESLASTKNYQGVTGNITFDKNRNPINKSAVILKFDKEKSVYVKTIQP